MNIYANEKLIKRNHKLGNIFSIGALVILAVGLFLPGNDFATTRSILALLCLVIGFLVFQLGNYYVNRWGKSPRPDELLTQSLKGLDNTYSLYHYETAVSHLLVGPCGVIALLPYGQNGFITYDSKKNDWKQRGGNFFLKIFGQEGLGRPNSEAKLEKRDLEKFIAQNNITIDPSQINVVLVFTNSKVDVLGEGSPVLYCKAEKLKDIVRKKAKEILFKPEKINSFLNSNNQ